MDSIKKRLLAVVAIFVLVAFPIVLSPIEGPAIASSSVELRSVGVSPGADWSPCVIVKPAGLAVDDLMIAHVISREAADIPGASSAPGGWTEIRQDAGEKMRSALFWKIAVQADVDASDFSFTVDDSGGFTSNIGAISAWTGHDATTPINANNGQHNSASTTVTSPAITPSVADCMILMLCGIGDDNTQSNYAIANDDPGGWTEAYDILTTAGGDCAAAMGYDIRPETTSTGLGTATTSGSDENVGQLVAIAPEGADAPTVTTQAVTDITDTTATGNGNITDTGGEDASAWGVCYNTTGNPTTADDTAAGTGSGGAGAFTASMTSLTPGEHYYVKAYATNSGGTGYGSQVEFDTKGPPSVTTSAADDIEETTATLNGNITSVNNGSCSARGFQWDIDSGAPYANDWSESDSYGTGVFDHGITSLAKGELYYFRAYATNTYGTGYGTELTFLTKPDAPYSLLATATADGVITLTWSKGEGAQNTYIRGEQGSYPTDRTDGYLVYNDTGVTTTDTGLTGGLVYYYRAWSYATEGGKEQYSDAYDEDYSAAIEVPSITTNNPTDVGNTYATYQANITATGGSLADYRGFVWDTTSRGDPGNTAPADSDYTDYNTTSGSYGTGSFTHEVTTLTERTPYYVRGCAHNTMGWSYGSEVSFSTREEVLYFQPNAIVVDTNATGTTDSGTTTTLVDDALTQGDDYWNNARLVITETTDHLAPEGETAVVTDFTATNDTLHFAALTVAVEADDTYTVDFGTLPDRAGDHDGTITWGSNPSGVAATIGALLPEASSAADVTADVESPSFAPETSDESWFETGTEGEGFPFYGLFKGLLDSYKDLGGADISMPYFWKIVAGLLGLMFGTFILLTTRSTLIGAAAYIIGFVVPATMGVLDWWMVIVYMMGAIPLCILSTKWHTV